MREAECADFDRIIANGPVVWGVAVCVRVGMRFCKVPVSEQDLFVTIKLSRWRGPDKWAGFVMLHLNCPDGDAKTMTTERRLATLLTLSWQQEQSRWHKIL